MVTVVTRQKNPALRRFLVSNNWLESILMNAKAHRMIPKKPGDFATLPERRSTDRCRLPSCALTEGATSHAISTA